MTTIANVVETGMNLADRLTELGIEDKVLFELVGELATGLATVMGLSSQVTVALAIASEAFDAGDLDVVGEGFQAIVPAQTYLTSGQAELEAKMMATADPAEAALLEALYAVLEAERAAAGVTVH